MTDLQQQGKHGTRRGGWPPGNHAGRGMGIEAGQDSFGGFSPYRERRSNKVIEARADGIRPHQSLRALRAGWCFREIFREQPMIDARVPTRIGHGRVAMGGWQGSVAGDSWLRHFQRFVCRPFGLPISGGWARPHQTDDRRARFANRSRGFGAASLMCSLCGRGRFCTLARVHARARISPTRWRSFNFFFF